VRVRKGGSETPLFLVHDGLGELLYVPALTSHIDPNIPIYGLPAQRAEEAPLQTMEGMATRMLRMIREVQPAGPYRLAGWSFGGVLAYEIAVQLEGADEVVEFVGLLDSYLAAVKDVIGTVRTQFDVEGTLLGKVQPSAECRSPFDNEKLQLALSEVISSAPGTDFTTLVQKFRESSLAPESWSQLTTPQVQEILTRAHSYNVTSFGYSAQRIPIPIHLFVAEDDHSSVPFLGWNTILPETQIREIPVPGTHFSMIARPNIETLGQAMSHAIHSAAKDSRDLGDLDFRPLEAL
jgi:arthrofactin-type cyclic lipopeptide synthetase C